MIYVITFILAFCSIVYELLLGQSLSAFLGNTVLRYSVTIGLYMFAMGIGAFLTEGKLTKNPALSLVKIELALTFLGGFSLIAMHGVHLILHGIFLSFFAHTLIIVIGILTGTEIPLLIEMGRKNHQYSSHKILGTDYIGALCGTIVFAFILYPHAGLVPSAFAVGLLNGIAGLVLVLKEKEGKIKPFFIGFQSVSVVLLGCLLYFSNEITAYLVAKYLG